MKLITEQVENVEYICEDVGGKKNYKIVVSSYNQKSKIEMESLS